MTVQFSATVTGDNSPGQSIIWTVTDGTSIAADGTLTVAADETTTSLNTVI
ncbi:MAG: hypothetical protein LBQ01_03160 [Prevotellaceae bacterium]|nr:hypothetical protein [Prevotellaceae bacterium]